MTVVYANLSMILYSITMETTFLIYDIETKKFCLCRCAVVLLWFDGVR